MTKIKIDWDKKSEPPVSLMLDLIDGLSLGTLTVLDNSLCPSPSGKHWHVKITVKQKISPVKVVAIQLLLGSDPYREFYNLFRVLRTDAPAWWRKRWNVLFKRRK